MIRPGEKRRRHGLGAVRSPAYRSWCHMRERCLGKTSDAYSSYGGRGIKIDPRWNDYLTFVADMGERPPGTTLDRINNDGDYTLSNCRWATSAQQNNNRRSSKLEPHEPAQIRWLVSLGYKQKDIALFFGVRSGMVSRINSGLRRSVA